MRRLAAVFMAGLGLAQVLSAQTGSTTPSAILAGFTPDFWWMLLAAAVSGAFGGFIYELLMLRGRIEMPHRVLGLAPGEDLGDGAAHKLIDLGLLARVLIGAGAAVAALWLIEPESAIALIAGSIIAGTAGIAIFRSLQDRLLALLAAQQTAEAKAQAVEAKTQTVETAMKALEIDQDFQQLREKLRGGAEVPKKVMRGDAESSFSLGASSATATALPELESISRKLGEMRGIAGRAMATPGGPVRLRALRVLSSWAGISEFPPNDRKVVDVWTQKQGNGVPTDGNLADLIVQLNAEFPRAELRLVPNDFRNGVNTVGKLIDHLEHQEPR